TNLAQNSTPLIKGYQSFTKNRQNCSRASGGVAILTSLTFPAQELPIIFQLEVIAIRLKAKENITICKIYLPNLTNFHQNDIQAIINQLLTPFFLLGDFNSHSTSWGSNHSNTRGRIIESVLNNPHIMLLNDGNDTHFTAASGNTSAIDLTLSSTLIGSNTEWKVIPAIYSSDHWPIIVNIKYRNSTHIYEIPLRWKLKNADWELYTQLVEYEIEKMNTPVNENVELTLENIILTTAAQTIGVTHYNSTKPPVPW
ncbi:putative RNA-directed DNA polymerase, partial [Aphis craccivora]